MHTLCGIMSSPHLLHFTSVGAVIFQFALLLSLLPLEDLFFGQIDISHTSLNLLKISCIAAILGYCAFRSQPHSRSLRFAPHYRQMPLLSYVQITFIGQPVRISL